MVVLDEIGDDKSGALRIKKELLWRHRQHNGQEHWQNEGLSIGKICYLYVFYQRLVREFWRHFSV